MNGTAANEIYEEFEVALQRLRSTPDSDSTIAQIRTRFAASIGCRMENGGIYSLVDTSAHVHTIMQSDMDDHMALKYVMIVLLRAETVPSTAPGFMDSLFSFRGDLFRAVWNAAHAWEV